MATIYRSLDLFLQHNPIRKCQFGDGRTRFVLVPGPGVPEEHHHLVCKNCGRIVDYDNFGEEETQSHSSFVGFSRTISGI